MLRFDMIAMFEDEETRRIMRTVAMKPGVHVNELIRLAQVVQNSFYPRLARLLDAKLLREKKVLNRRQFYLTKRGYRAILEDGTTQRRDFESVLRETKLGKEMLEEIENMKAIVEKAQTAMTLAKTLEGKHFYSQAFFDDFVNEIVKAINKACAAYDAKKLSSEAFKAISDFVEPTIRLIHKVQTEEG